MPKIHKTIFKGFVVLLILPQILFPMSAHGSNNEECLFGQRYIEGEYDVDSDSYDSTCEAMTWDYSTSSDGFAKRMILSMDEDLYGLSGITIAYLTMVVRCENKKLEVYFASSYILFNNQNRTYSHNLQYKIDSGKTVNTTFSEATSDKALFVVSPKTFLTNMFKGKNRLSIKFGRSSGSQVSAFPMADFGKYRSKLASAGCKI